jgi:hypothetical protein
LLHQCKHKKAQVIVLILVTRDANVVVAWEGMRHCHIQRHSDGNLCGVVRLGFAQMLHLNKESSVCIFK